MALEGKGVLVRPRRSKVPPWRGIGIHLEKFEGRVGDSVAPANVVGCGEKGPRLHGAIGATGMDRSHLASGQTPVTGHARTNRYDGRMCGIAGSEFFPVAHHNLHRTLGHLRQEVGDGQVTSVSLAPEIAPYRDDIHSDLLVP